MRRKEVARLLAESGPGRRGAQARIARELGVSEATVCRDVRHLRLFEWALANPAEALRRLYGSG